MSSEERPGRGPASGWAGAGGDRGPRSGGAAPGWRPDPEGRFEQRFHDGHRWTPRVRVGEAVALDTGADADPDAETDVAWYPDPTARFEQRAFANGRWTKRVRAGRAVAIDTQGAGGKRRPRGSEPAGNRTATERSPGWYPDPRPTTSDGRDFWDPRPDLRERERYWDGYEWTAKVRETGGRRERAPARLFMSRALIILCGLVVAVGVGVVLLLVLL